MSFAKAAFLRALRTTLQAFIAVAGTATVLSDVDWPHVLSATAIAGILALVTAAIGGLPEAPDEPTRP